MEISFEHDGITVTCDKDTEMWGFTLRGRLYKVETPSEAKLVIDRVVQKKETTKPVEAFFRYGRYGEIKQFKPLVIDSIAITPRYYVGSDTFVWIRFGDERKKEVLSLLAAETPENRALAEQVRVLNENIENAKKEVESLLNAMTYPDLSGLD